MITFYKGLVVTSSGTVLLSASTVVTSGLSSSAPPNKSVMIFIPWSAVLLTTLRISSTLKPPIVSSDELAGESSSESSLFSSSTFLGASINLISDLFKSKHGKSKSIGTSPKIFGCILRHPIRPPFAEGASPLNFAHIFASPPRTEWQTGSSGFSILMIPLFVRVFPSVRFIATPSVWEMYLILTQAGPKSNACVMLKSRQQMQLFPSSPLFWQRQSLSRSRFSAGASSSSSERKSENKRKCWLIFCDNKTIRPSKAHLRSTSRSQME